MKRSSTSSTDSPDNEKKRSREDIPGQVNMEGPSQSSQAQLCRNGCGFYGSSKNEGMCSMCYKDTVQKKNNSGRKSPAVSHILNKPDLTSSTETHNDGSVANAMASLATNDAPTTTISAANRSPPNPAVSSPIAIPTAAQPDTSLTTHSPQSSSFDAGTSFEDSSPSKPKKTRCNSCRKRLGLTGFYCRCGKHFCSLHRYSDQHNCDFDYKADAQAKIRKENPVIVGEKINKI